MCQGWCGRQSTCVRCHVGFEPKYGIAWRWPNISIRLNERTLAPFRLHINDIAATAASFKFVPPVLHFEGLRGRLRQELALSHVHYNNITHTMQFNLPILCIVRCFKDLVQIVPAQAMSAATQTAVQRAVKQQRRVSSKWHLYVTKSTVFQSVKPLCAAASITWRIPPTTTSSTGLKVDRPWRTSVRQGGVHGLSTMVIGGGGERTSFRFRGGCCGT